MLKNLKDFKSAILPASIRVYSLQRQFFFATNVCLVFIWKMKEGRPCGLQNLTDKLHTEEQNGNKIRLNCDLY
jgi:hypothetical protein